MALTPYNGNVAHLYNPNNCITIPRYQRKYSWSVVNAHHLIYDLMNTLTSKDNSGNHWIGAAITRDITIGQCEVGQKDYNHRCVELIDGQQRFTTLRLWMLAVEHYSQSIGAPLKKVKLAKLRLQSPNDDQLQKITTKKLAVANEKNEISQVYTYFRYLLWLGQDALLSADVIQIPKGKLKGQTVEDKWTDWLEKQKTKGINLERSAKLNPRSLIDAAIKKLDILYLEIDNEDPVRIFSALNGNRQELSQFDHLRNSVFAQLSSQLPTQEKRDQVFDKYWKIAEEILEQVPTGRGSNSDKVKNEFLYDYLISVGEGHFGKFSSENTYSAIVKYLNRIGISNLQNWVKGLASEVQLWTIQKYDFQFSGQLKNQTDIKLHNRARLILQRIRHASDGPPSALVVFALRRRFIETDPLRRFDEDQLYKALRGIEKILFKTILSGKSLTTFGSWSIKNLHSINKDCISIGQKTSLDIFLEKIEKYQPLKWKSVRSLYENSFNSPESKSLYESNPRACLAILDVINEELTGGSNISLLPVKNVGSGDAPFWIEHIYPQDDALWISDLGKWKVTPESMKLFLHDFGNLSVLPDAVNKSISNKALADKKQILRKVQNSRNGFMIPVLNDSWLSANEWAEKQISSRSATCWKKLQERWGR